MIILRFGAYTRMYDTAISRQTHKKVYFLVSTVLNRVKLNIVIKYLGC